MGRELLGGRVLCRERGRGEGGSVAEVHQGAGTWPEHAAWQIPRALARGVFNRVQVPMGESKLKVKQDKGYEGRGKIHEPGRG